MGTKREPRSLRDLMDDDARHWASMPDDHTDSATCGDCPAFVACDYRDDLVRPGWGFCVIEADVEAVDGHSGCCGLFCDEFFDVRARVTALDMLEAAEAEFDARSGR